MYWECAYTYVYIYIYHTGGLLSTVASIYAHASGYWSSGLRVSFFFFFSCLRLWDYGQNPWITTLNFDGFENESSDT